MNTIVTCYSVTTLYIAKLLFTRTYRCNTVVWCYDGDQVIPSPPASSSVQFRNNIYVSQSPIIEHYDGCAGMLT